MSGHRKKRRGPKTPQAQAVSREAEEVDGLVEIRIHLRAVSHDILRGDVSLTRSCSRSAINPGPTGSHPSFFRVCALEAGMSRPANIASQPNQAWTSSGAMDL